MNLVSLKNNNVHWTKMWNKFARIEHGLFPVWHDLGTIVYFCFFKKFHMLYQIDLNYI